MRYAIFTILFFCALVSCDRSDDTINTDLNQGFVPATVCVDGIFIEEDLYNTAPNDDYWLSEITIEGDCLVGKINYSGCNRDIDFSFVAFRSVDDAPTIIQARISLEQEGLCEPLFIADISYELKGLQVDGANQVQISFVGWDEQLIYKY